MRLIKRNRGRPVYERANSSVLADFHAGISESHHLVAAQCSKGAINAAQAVLRNGNAGFSW